MATESYAKTFTVDCRSEKCMSSILQSKKTTVINCKKTFAMLSKDEILKYFGNGTDKKI